MPQSRRARAMLAARVILIVQVATAAVLAPATFYVVGFSTQPHRVGLATFVTCLAIVLSGGATWLIYRVQKARASQLSDVEPWNG